VDYGCTDHTYPFVTLLYFDFNHVKAPVVLTGAPRIISVSMSVKYNE
jgi:hypothetical protein